MAIYHKDYCFEIVVENKTYIKYPSMAIAYVVYMYTVGRQQGLTNNSPILLKEKQFLHRLI